MENIDIQIDVEDLMLLLLCLLPKMHDHFARKPCCMEERFYLEEI